MVPWGVALQNPTFLVLVPFTWLLWQIYCPRLINRAVGKPRAEGFIYDTWWTSAKREFKSELTRMDDRMDDMGESVSHIADTQERLVDITIAQSKMMDGHDDGIKVEHVEEDLRDEEDRSHPSDYLRDDADERDRAW